MVRKAAGGDLSAAKYILEAVQEDRPPVENTVDLSDLSTAELQELLKEAGHEP